MFKENKESILNYLKKMTSTSILFSSLSFANTIPSTSVINEILTQIDKNPIILIDNKPMQVNINYNDARTDIKDIVSLQGSLNDYEALYLKYPDKIEKRTFENLKKITKDITQAYFEGIKKNSPEIYKQIQELGKNAFALKGNGGVFVTSLDLSNDEYINLKRNYPPIDKNQDISAYQTHHLDTNNDGINDKTIPLYPHYDMTKINEENDNKLDLEF